MVDLVRKEWNQLETMVIDWAEVLRGCEKRASERALETHDVS